MNDILRLDRKGRRLWRADGHALDPATRTWTATGEPPPGDGETLDARAAVAWLQHESGARVRTPVGIIGPREATPAQLEAARRVGAGVATMGLAVICGGRHGIMEAAARGAHSAGGVSIGMLPDPDPSFANPYITHVIATGIGEARNALIARAALCLVAIGDSFGTLSEVALGRQFGKTVVGLEGAADVDGVIRAASPDEALAHVARTVLGL